MNVIFQKHRYILLTLLLFFLVNVYAVSRLLTLRGYVDRIALCCPEGSLSASVWEQQENGSGDEKNEAKELFSQAALWRSLKEITVSSEQTGREQKVSCYQIKGQPEAVFWDGLLLGRYFTEKEENVCLLDRDTARKLFGSEQVLEMKVRINGTCCRIVGVLSENRPICVLPSGAAGGEGGGSSGGGSGRGDAASAGGNSGAFSVGGEGGFDGAAVRKKETGQSSGLTISRMETVFGKAGGQRIDGHLYYMTACLIYSGTLSLLFALVGIGLGKRKHKKWIAAVCLAAAAGILWLGIRCAAPGSDYLPTFWSDFDFFSRIFQEKSKQIGELAAYQEFSAWQNIFHAWQQVIVAGIFGCVLCASSFVGAEIAKKGRDVL